MISLKRLLGRDRNGYAPSSDVFEALRQMGRLLLKGIANHRVRGYETDFNVLRGALHGLERQLDEPESASGLVSSSSAVAVALETFCNQTTERFSKEKKQLQSMVAMLTGALAGLSGQTDDSLARLRTIEKELQMASGLDGMRAVRSHLEIYLLALREAAAQPGSKCGASVQLPRDGSGIVHEGISGDPRRAPFGQAEIDLLPDHWDELAESVQAQSSYVAAFKLQRAEHISMRFGETAKYKMLSTLGAELKDALGPGDRLLRWKGGSFVMFINSTATIAGVRAQLAQAVARIGVQSIEVGKKSALLAVCVDWTIFPQSDHASLEAILAEVESFLTKNETSLPAQLRDDRSRSYKKEVGV